MAGIQDWYPYPITQGYGVPNPQEPGGWHHGVDIGMPGGAAVLAPVAGTYDPAASGAYQVAEDIPGQGELIFMHVANALAGAGAQAIMPGENLGSVLSYNPQTGEDFRFSEGYSDPATGMTYFETGPHLHLEAHSVAGAKAGSAQGVEDPANLFAGLAGFQGAAGSSAYPRTTAPSLPGSAGVAGATTTTIPPAIPGTAKSTTGAPGAGGCQHSILGLCLDDAATWGQRASIAAVLVVSGLLLITLGIRHETYGLAAGMARAAA